MFSEFTGFPKSRPRFPNLARGFQSLARDFRFKCLCLELRVGFLRSISFRCQCSVCSCVHTSLDGVADSIAAMGGACLLNMYADATIIAYNNNNHNIISSRLVSSHIISYHPLSLSLSSLSSLSSPALSLSLMMTMYHALYPLLLFLSLSLYLLLLSLSLSLSHLSVSPARSLFLSLISLYR